MDSNAIISYVMGEAAKSNVEKRQVGCVIVGDNVVILATGYNTEEVHAEAMACESLIAQAVELKAYKEIVCYVTHQPCPNCATLLFERGITKVEVVEAFMKFDGDKTRFDLVEPEFSLELMRVSRHVTANEPRTDYKMLWNDLRVYQAQPSAEFLVDLTLSIYGGDVMFAERSIAEVLTMGARKYKPNNWRKCVDTGRYLSAAFRHLELLIKGEDYDAESGLHHRAHIATNLMFLFALGYNNDY